MTTHLSIYVRYNKLIVSVLAAIYPVVAPSTIKLTDFMPVFLPLKSIVYGHTEKYIGSFFRLEGHERRKEFLMVAIVKEQDRECMFRYTV
jgi:hypothetical protein